MALNVVTFQFLSFSAQLILDFCDDGHDALYDDFDFNYFMASK